MHNQKEWGWRDGSVLKGTVGSSKGLGFNSPSHATAYNVYFKFQRSNILLWPPQALCEEDIHAGKAPMNTKKRKEKEIVKTY